MDPRIKTLELYAWVGEDDLLPPGAPIGLKQGLCPAGMIPLVSVDPFKLRQAYILRQMQSQATAHGKTIRLCRFVFAEVGETLEPGG